MKGCRSLKKTCPRCAERIKSLAKTCRHCSYDFGPKEVSYEFGADIERSEIGESSAEKVGSIGCALLLILGAAIGVHQCVQQNEPTTEELYAEADAIMAAREKGFHCLSGWDGSNASLVQQVEASLRDPGSFEHIETSIAPAHPETGKHGIDMTFRSKNGFGGMNVGHAVGEVDPASCDATKIVVDGGQL